MKYDILVQKGGFLYVKVCQWISTGYKTIFPKKNLALLAQKLGGGEVAWTTNSLGGGGKTLVVRQLKKNFMCVFPYR